MARVVSGFCPGFCSVMDAIHNCGVESRSGRAS